MPYITLGKDIFLNNEVKYLDTGFGVTVVAATTRYGKCISYEVVKEDGSVCFIGDIKVGDKVFSLSEIDYKIKISKILNKISNGIKPVYELITKTGRRIKLTLNHPLYTPLGWKPLELLKKGDFIAVPRVIPVEGTDDCDVNTLRILGYLLGCGGISGNSISFTKKDLKIIREIRSSLPKGIILKKVNGKYHYSIRSVSRKKKANTILNWLREIGLMGCNSHTKKIPTFVFKLKNKLIAELLNRMYCCDGWISIVSKKKIPQVGYCSVSLEMIHQIQHLLLRFGILSTIHQKNVKYKGSIKVAYEIIINGKESIFRFFDDIGIFSKEDKINEVKKAYLLKGNSNECFDVIPKEWIDVDIDRFYTICRKKDINFNNEKHRKCIGRKTFKNIVSEKIIPFTYKIDSDILWDKVKNIKYLYDDEVFDIEVENNHNFISGDIFVHNSSIVKILTCAMAQYRSVIIFDYRGEHFQCRYPNFDAEEPLGIADLMTIDEFPLYISDLTSPEFWEPLGFAEKGADNIALLSQRVDLHDNNPEKFQLLLDSLPSNPYELKEFQKSIPEWTRTLHTETKKGMSNQFALVKNLFVSPEFAEENHIEKIENWGKFFNSQSTRHFHLNLNLGDTPSDTAKAKIIVGLILNQLSKVFWRDGEYAPHYLKDLEPLIIVEESDKLAPNLGFQNVAIFPISLLMLREYVVKLQRYRPHLIFITQDLSLIDPVILSNYHTLILGQLTDTGFNPYKDDTQRLRWDIERNYREFIIIRKGKWEKHPFTARTCCCQS